MIGSNLFSNITKIGSTILFLKPTIYNLKESLFGLYIYRLPFQSRTKAIGFIDWKLHLTFGEIINLNVSNPYRNKRFGTYLLKYAINDIKNNGVKNIVVNVEKHNKNASSMYEKEGFKFVENHKFKTHYYTYPLMVKYIK